MGKEKAITLIALVITIIVLLILAGVSIATLTGQNGLLTKANTAKIRQSHAQVEEAIKLAYAEYQTEKLTPSETGKILKSTKIASIDSIKIAGHLVIQNISFIEFLEYKQYIDEDGVIETEALTGGKTPLGNGTDSIDVYKIEEDETNHQYVLTYYETADKTEELCTIKYGKTKSTKTVKIYTDSSLSEVYLEFSYVEGMTWKDVIESGLDEEKLIIELGFLIDSAHTSHVEWSEYSTNYIQSPDDKIELRDYYLSPIPT